jgi:hypothetical protein
MARTKSTASLIGELPAAKQIQVQGIRFMIDAQAAHTTPTPNVAEKLTWEFLNYLRSERSEEFQNLVADFAIAQVSA